MATTRDDALAYLCCATPPGGRSLSQPADDVEPAFVARARERATCRALAELDQPIGATGDRGVRPRDGRARVPVA